MKKDKILDKIWFRIKWEIIDVVDSPFGWLKWKKEAIFDFGLWLVVRLVAGIFILCPPVMEFFSKRQTQKFWQEKYDQKKGGER